MPGFTPCNKIMHWIATHLMWWTPWVMSKHRNTEARKSLPGTCHIHTHTCWPLSTSLTWTCELTQKGYSKLLFYPDSLACWVLHLFLCYLLNIATVFATMTVVRFGEHYNWDIWTSLFISSATSFPTLTILNTNTLTAGIHMLHICVSYCCSTNGCLSLFVCQCITFWHRMVQHLPVHTDAQWWYDTQWIPD